MEFCRGDEVDDGAQVLEGAETSCPGDGSLDRGIDGLGPGVRVARGQHVADALDVGLKRLRQPLEWHQAGASAPAEPALHQQHHRHLRQVAPGQDVAQRLLDLPSPRGAAARHAQPVQIDLGAGPVGGVLEPVEARALERRQLADLVPPHLLQCLVGQLHQVEGVQAQRGVRQVCRRPGDVGPGHVQGAGGHLRGVAAMFGQRRRERAQVARLAALADVQHFARAGLVHHGDGAQATDVFLVHAHRIDRAHVDLCVGPLDHGVQRAPQALVGHTQQAADLPHRHARHPHQGQHQCLEQQGEAAALARPRHGDLLHLRIAPIRTGPAAHARYCRMHQGAVLEEVQVLPIPQQAVVDRLIRRATARTREPLCIADHVEVDLLGLRLEANLLHPPGRLQPKGCGEQLGHRIGHRKPPCRGTHLNPSGPHGQAGSTPNVIDPMEWTVGGWWQIRRHRLSGQADTDFARHRTRSLRRSGSGPCAGYAGQRHRFGRPRSAFR